jgi:hypothetical protein
LPQKHDRPDAQFERAVVDCVVRSVGDVSLDQMRESPDADLLDKSGHHVGLEIVRPADHKGVDASKRIQAATKEVRQQLDDQEVLVTLHVVFDLADMGAGAESVHRTWRREIPVKIANFVRSHPDGRFDEKTLKANGITRIASVEWKRASKAFVGYGWRSFTRRGATLVDICLAKKHERLHYYRTLNGNHFREYWLAIAGYGAGTLEDGGFSMLLTNAIMSSTWMRSSRRWSNAIFQICAASPSSAAKVIVLLETA